MEASFVPERLHEAMNGMSNIELAEKLGCARSNITMYLSGTRTPSKMTVQLMSICLGVSPAWLVGISDEKYLQQKPTTVSDDGRSEIDAIFERLSPDNQAKLHELAHLFLGAQRKTEENE